MTYTLTVSSQGQIVIPSKVRKHLGIKPGNRIVIRSSTQGRVPTAVIEPKVSWVKRVSGIAKGIYGKGEEYIDKERETWDK